MTTTKRFMQYTIATVLFLSIAACGETTGERALSGGAIGAGAGVGAAVLGAPTVPAVLVGTAVGATAGALTTKKQVDLSQ